MVVIYGSLIYLCLCKFLPACVKIVGYNLVYVFIFIVFSGLEHYIYTDIFPWNPKPGILD